MVQERIDIVISERGSRTVSRNIERVGTTADRVSNVVTGLTQALALLGGTAVLGSFARANDTFIEIGNRIRVVTDESENLAAVQRELLQVSNATFSSVESNTQIYARLRIALDQYGFSTGEVIDLTQTLAQASLAQGASAQEANAALIQLAQGLGSGRVSGEEFRSVAEQLTILLPVFAREAGVTAGQLRNFANDQKLTTDIVVNALRNFSDEATELVGNVNLTLGRAFQILNNNFIQFVGTAEQSLNVFGPLIQSVIFLADNLDTIARGATLAAAAFGPQLLAGALSLAAAAAGGLLAILTANPFLLIASVVSTAAAAIALFGNEIRLSEGSIVTLQDVAVATFNRIADVAGSAGETVSTGFGDIFENISDDLPGFRDDVVGTFVELTVGIGAFIRTIDQAISEFVISATLLFARLGLSIAEALNFDEQIPGLRADIAALEDAVAQGVTTGFFESLAAGVQSEVDAIFDAAEARALERQESFQEGAGVERRLTEFGPQAGAQEAGGRGRSRATFAQLIEDLQEEVTLLNQVGDAREVLAERLAFENQLRRELLPTEAQQVESLVRETIELERRRDVLQSVVGPEREILQQQQILNDLFQEGEVSLQQYNVALEDLQDRLDAITDRYDPLGARLRQFSEEAQDTGTQLGNALQSSFGRAETALTQFLTTGELNFENFANSLIADLARIAIRSQILGPLTQILGGGGGGIGGGGLLGSIGSLFGGGAGVPTPSFPQFQTGGLVAGAGTGTSDSNLVRVSDGEFIVNASATRANLGALTAINSGAPVGGATNITIIDQRTVGEDEDDNGVRVNETQGMNGSKEIQILIRDSVRRDISNGEFNAALGRQFGLQQQGINR